MASEKVYMGTMVVAEGKNLQLYLNRAYRLRGMGTTRMKITGYTLMLFFPDSSYAVTHFADKQVLKDWVRDRVKLRPYMERVT